MAERFTFDRRSTQRIGNAVRTTEKRNGVGPEHRLLALPPGQGEGIVFREWRVTYPEAGDYIVFLGSEDWRDRIVGGYVSAWPTAVNPDEGNFMPTGLMHSPVRLGFEYSSTDVVIPNTTALKIQTATGRLYLETTEDGTHMNFVWFWAGPTGYTEVEGVPEE
jgi:hypothetical protein